MALTPTGTPQPKAEPNIEAANAAATEMIAGWVSYNVKYTVTLPEPERPKNRAGFWVTDTDENMTFWFSDDHDKGADYWFRNWDQLHGNRYWPAEASRDGFQLYLDLPLNLNPEQPCCHGFLMWENACPACRSERGWRP